jgi:hypothetical protein
VAGADPFQVVIKKDKAASRVPVPKAAPGIGPVWVDPGRRILVMMNAPTRDLIDCIKVSGCINTRAEARGHAYRVVVVYGSKGGDMSLHLDVGSSTEKMWEKRKAVEQGLMDAGIVGFQLERDW